MIFGFEYKINSTIVDSILKTIYLSKSAALYWSRLSYYRKFTCNLLMTFSKTLWYWSAYGWLVYWGLMPLSSIFQLYWWRKPEYPEKTTDLSQVTSQTSSHNKVSRTPRLNGISKLTTSVVIGTDCIGS
jgi:hypothetical protein